MPITAVTLDNKEELKSLKSGEEVVVESSQGLGLGQTVPLFMDFQRLPEKAVVSKIIEETGMATKVYIKLAEQA